MFSGNTMSCMDVMYPSYTTYFPYHHHHHHANPHQRPSGSSAMHGSLDLKKFGVSSKLSEPMDTSPVTYGGGLVSSPGSGGGGHTSPTSTPAAPGGTAPKEESDPDRAQGTNPRRTQYLSANCVLVTYFSGDIASNVDDHFSRALSQPSSFSEGTQGQSPKNSDWKEISPMASRNFPPSFWNSAYQAPSASSHQDLPGFTGDPYSHMTSSLHGVHGSLHTDPWRYGPLSTQTYGHHGMHDFGYSSAAMASSSRFTPHHYSSLLPTAGRFSSMGGQCDPLGKHSADTWGSRYGHSDLASHHDSAAMSLHVPGGIEATMGTDSKDLYWF